MVDVFSKEKRSDIMREVKSRYNKSTEMQLISFFKTNHIIGWRRNFKLFGKPDFTFPKKRIVIFTDGCFWHGHDCRNTKPSDNAEYWEKKITGNKARDLKVSSTLTEKRWTVIRLWECELKKPEILMEKLSGLFE